MRTFKTTLGAAILGAALLASTGNAATTPVGGKIQIYVTGIPSARQPILIAGAIGDYGTATSETKAGKVDANGNYVHIALKNGTFLVDATKLNASKGKLLLQNKATCSFVFRLAGPITISDGTGSYKGISGSARMTITFGGVGPFYATGAKKGQCNQSKNANPSGQYTSITGTGAVKFN